MKKIGIIFIIAYVSLLFSLFFVGCNKNDDTSEQKNNFTDSRDGKVYSTVTIGEQVWMAENLSYLPSVSDPVVNSYTIPYYYVWGYFNENVDSARVTNNFKTYGTLYNWAAAMAGSESDSSNPSSVQGVCPDGWHLPSDAEWTQLTDYLGGDSLAGGKLKETGTIHWNSPNTSATNETGFSALPGGNTGVSEGFYRLKNNGEWWSATETETDVEGARNRYMSHDRSDVSKGSGDKRLGYSVRCVKD